MAVAPNSPILISDMQTLATTANGKTSLSFNDPFGGVWAFSDIYVVNPGSGYVAGDIITANGATVKVQTVSDTGQIVGIKFISRGSFSVQPANGVYNCSGGSGTGSQFYITWIKKPTTRFYSFTLPPSGLIRGLLLKSGGTGYTVGDTLTVPLPVTVPATASVTVSTVDPNGVILTWTVNWVNYVTNYSFCQSSASGGTGNGASFWIYYQQNEDSTWAQELSRMRADVATALASKNGSPTLSVSGALTDSGDIGWPVAGPSFSYRELAYYYPDTGNNETVTISGNLIIESRTGFSTSHPVVVIFNDTGTISGLQEVGYATSLSGGIVVAGTQPVLIQADIYFGAMVNVGWTWDIVNDPAPTYDNPNIHDYITVTKDLGLGTFEIVALPLGSMGLSSESTYVFAVWHVNQLVNPGTYTAAVSSTVSDATETITRDGTGAVISDVFVQPTDSILLSGSNTSFLQSGGYMQYTADNAFNVPNPTVSLPPYDSPIPTNGIHNSKRVMKIKVFDSDGLTASIYSIWNDEIPLSTGTGLPVESYLANGDIPGLNPPDITAQFPNEAYIGNFNQGTGNFYILVLGAKYYIVPSDSIGNFSTNQGTGIITASETFVISTRHDGPIIYLYSEWNPPWPQPQFGPQYLRPSVINANFALSYPYGLWLAECPMISGGIANSSKMPWNQLRHLPATSGQFLQVNPLMWQNQLYNQLAPIEVQYEPPNWAPGKFATPGTSLNQAAIINDGYGNFWKCTSSFGSSTTGSSFPFTTKTPSVGTTVTEDTVTYNNGTPIHNGVIWTCVSVFYDTSVGLWKPSTGQQVSDLRVDSNGNTVQAITEGTTGATPPVWSTVSGGTTVDGSVMWKMVNPAKPYLSAIHRFLSEPRYPFYWTQETNAFLIPPDRGGSDPSIWGTRSQWTGDTYQSISEPGWAGSTRPPNGGTNQAYGWWIYKVSINRLGTVNKDGLNVPQGQSIPVTIGCIRNGSFAAFGTYQTGQTIDAMWPIFTSDPIVYQATERVDLQATVIGGPCPQGTSVAYPIMASFYEDTNALLSLTF